MNITNITYYSIDIWLKKFGSFYEIDILYVYVLIPLASLSFAFNLTSFIVLLNSSFSISAFYRYMWLYSLNSALLSLLIITTFINTTHRIFSFTNTYPALIYGTYFKEPLQTALYLYSSFLEICIVINKSLYFFPKRLNKTKYFENKKYFIILFALSIIVSLPMFFILEPTYTDVELGKDEWFRIYTFGITNFSYTLAGKAVSYLLYFIRDIFALIVKLVLNIMTVVLVKQYTNRLKKEKAEFELRLSSSALSVNDATVVPNNDGSRQTNISKTDRNQTYTAIVICLFSIVEHVLYVMTFFFLDSAIAAYFYYFALLSLTLKHGSNVFVFYRFNFLFRTRMNKCFKSIF